MKSEQKFLLSILAILAIIGILQFGVFPIVNKMLDAHMQSNTVVLQRGVPQKESRINSRVPIVNTEAVELEEYSCSYLENCPTKIVPSGAFTLTFKKVGELREAKCNWNYLQEGERINYENINEFFSYPSSVLLGTTVEEFANKAKETVFSCQSHSAEGQDVKTYYPEFSAIEKVPTGTFTVGFKRIYIGKDSRGNDLYGCTSTVWAEGERIDQSSVDEIFTYNEALPYTSMDSFIDAQKPFIRSCDPY